MQLLFSCRQQNQGNNVMGHPVLHMEEEPHTKGETSQGPELNNVKCKSQYTHTHIHIEEDKYTPPGERTKYQQNTKREGGERSTQKQKKLNETCKQSS